MLEFELGLVGAGNMAEALLRGVLRSGWLPAACIAVSDPSPERRAIMSALGVFATADNAVPADCPVVVLAVKPQLFPDVLAEIAPHIGADALVVSIAAGVTSAEIDRRLGGHGHVVRTMPNTPMLVGAGVTAVAAGPRAGNAHVEKVRDLMATCGRALIVAEDSIDAVTAVSGSGPAYVFYLAEAMIRGGVAEGLPEEDARTLAVETIVGAGRLMQESDDDPAELRRRVCSAGGTTQRAIDTLEASDTGRVLTSAVRASAARSRELGGD